MIHPRRPGLLTVPDLVSLSILLVLVTACVPEQSGTAPYDALITNARVVDGAGNPWFRADVGIRGDRIADVGDLAPGRVLRRQDR